MRPVLQFLSGLIFTAVLFVSINRFHYAGFPVFWIFAVLIMLFTLPSFSFILDSSVLLVVWLVTKSVIPQTDQFLYLNLAVMVLIVSSSRMNSVFAVLITWVCAIVFCIPGLQEFRMIDTVFVATALISLLLNSRVVPVRERKPITAADILLCSYTGNTAHYTHKFIEGLKQQNVAVKIHRFHYYRDFTADLTGDALVIAFPVIGWKPPWPMVDYLLRRLPRGGNKPAFILYTSGGGPENAGFVAWLLLALKGYRVMGRSGAVYPINVPTARLMPQKVHRFLDTLLPVKYDLRLAHSFGMQFAQGKITGIPHFVWPFPLIVAGFILDNKYLDRIYHLYAFKKRCTGCGACVRYCPSRRISLVDGRPKARGECALCMGCINLCPTNAMQALFFTEYGRRYKPRWSEMIVRKERE